MPEPARAKTLLFVWHSQTGGTAAMVQAAGDAARAQAGTDVHVRSLHADQAGPADVLQADLLVLATPECLAAVSGRLKDFLDRCYYPLLERCAGKPCALMVCAGNDGQAAIAQLRRVVAGWRLVEVAAPVLVRTGAQTPEAILAPKTLGEGDRARCAELGATLAAALALGVY